MESKLALVAAGVAVLGGLVLGSFTSGLFAAAIAGKNDGLRLYGIVTYTLKDPDGNIKWQETHRNKITDEGEAIMASIFANTAEDVDDICIGEGSATAVAENGAGAALVDNLDASGTDNLGTVCKAGTTTDNAETGGTPRTIKTEATWTFGTEFLATETVNEAVLTDCSGGGGDCTAGTGAAGANTRVPETGETFARQTFTGISGSSGDSLTISWTVTFSED